MLPAIVPVALDAPFVRLIQNAGSTINERCEGGDVGSGEEDDGRRFSNEEEVPSLCGAALFVRRRALDAAGWFPSYYTMYYEDTDLCLRLRAQGGLLIFCPSSVVNHYHTGTNREHSPRFTRNVARSSLLFVSRYGSPRQLARTVAGRMRDVRAELLHGAWRAAPGTLGVLSALPALPSPLAARLREALRSPAVGAELISARRAPYIQQR